MTTPAAKKPALSRPRFPWGILPTAPELDAMLGRTAPEQHRRRAGGMWEVFETRAAYSASDLYSVQSGIAVIRLYGMISSVWWADTPAAALVKAIDAAGADPAVSGAILDIDSPGGEVGVMSEIVAALRRFPKPIAAFAHNTCASCAYWAAAQCDKIYATPTSMLGCIGVYTKFVDDAAWLAEMGITEHLVASTELKGITEPGQPFTDKVRAMLQHEIDEAFGLFVADVAVGRDEDEATVRGWAGGAGTPTNFWHGAKALELGVADEITDFATLLAGLAGGGTSLDTSRRTASGRRVGASPSPTPPPRAAGKERAMSTTTTTATAPGTATTTKAKGSLDELKEKDPEGYKALMAEAASAVKAAQDAEEKTEETASRTPATVAGAAGTKATPATLGELKTLIPEGTPDREKVILAALDAGDSPILAMGRANAAMATRITALEQAKATPAAPTLKGVGAGVPAVPGAPAAGGEAKGDYLAMGRARAAEKKIKIGQALVEIDRENPGLRDAYLKAQAAAPKAAAEA